MSKSAKTTLQTNTAPQQLLFKNHLFTMGAAFAGVVFGVLGSLGFVGNYMDSQFAAQTAALDKRLIASAPAAALTQDGCYGTSTASVAPTAQADKAVVHKAQPHSMMADAASGGRGGETPVHSAKGDKARPFVSQLISGSISNTGPNSTATINASNDFDYTVTNNNDVKVTNSNNQTSSAGSATTSNNTSGGASSTGDAENVNTTHTAVRIDN